MREVTKENGVKNRSRAAERKTDYLAYHFGPNSFSSPATWPSLFCIKYVNLLLSQRLNCQHPLDYWKSKRVPEKHLFCFIDYAKAFECVDHHKLVEEVHTITERWSYCIITGCSLVPGSALWTRGEILNTSGFWLCGLQNQHSNSSPAIPNIVTHYLTGSDVPLIFCPALSAVIPGFIRNIWSPFITEDLASWPPE